MRATLLAFLVVTPVVVLLSCSDKKDSRGSGGGGAKEEEPVTAGTLAVVTGTIQPAEGADVSTVAGALVEAEGHPEISAVTDENGNFGIENVLPGTIALYVGSNDGGAAALKLEEGKGIGPTAYGLKIPDVVLKSGEVTDLGEQPLKKTGGFSGKVVFYSNPNNLDLTGSDVFVPGTGFIVKTDANGAFSLGGLPPGKYNLRAQHTGFAVLDIKDVEITEGGTTNLGDIALSLSTGPEGSIDISSDMIRDIGVKKDVKIVKSKNVKINLVYDSDAALMKVSDDPSFTNKEWAPVENTSQWPFTSDGSKTLYVMYSDLNGLESSPYSVDFIVDTEKPIVAEISLMMGWSQLSSTATKGLVDVDATDSGTGVEKMMLSNTSNFSVNSGWISFDPHYKNWAPASDTWVKVMDFAGRESDAKTDHINRGTYSMVRAGSYKDAVLLAKAQHPFRFEDNVTFESDLTVEDGVDININMSSSGKKVSIFGRTQFLGKSSNTIGITTNGFGFDGFDTTESKAEDNKFTHIEATGTMSGATLFVIDGGNVSHVDVSGSNLATLVKKKGYASLLVEHNNVSAGVGPSIHVASGSSATTIRHNNLAQIGMAPVIYHAGDTDTLVEYNTLVSVNVGAGDITAASLTNGSSATYRYNSLSATGAASGRTIYIISGSGTSTVHMNNLEVNDTANSAHIFNELMASTVSSTQNAFSGCGASCSNPSILGANSVGIINSGTAGADWPTSGTKDSGCVGHACTDD